MKPHETTAPFAKQQLSAVAGILDERGGLRVVVTQGWRMKFHRKSGEQIFVVPDLKVQEPVPWDKIPWLIATVEKHVAKRRAPHNACGTCHACCELPFIKDGDFTKPSNALCTRCEVGFGCKEYWRRPKVCQDFKCTWLRSQSGNDPMPAELRPDRSGVIFAPDSVGGDIHLVEVMTRARNVNEVRPPAIAAWMDAQEKLGVRFKFITHYNGEVGR